MGEDWSLDTGYGVMGRGGVLGLIQILVRAAGLNKHQPCTLNTDSGDTRPAAARRGLGETIFININI